MVRQSIAWGLLLLISVMSAAASASQGAERLVRETTDEVIEALATNQALYRQDPAALEEMMRRVVVPRFDMDRIPRWILGKSWQDASEAEQSRFREAFTTLLLRTFSTALQSFDGGVTYLPAEPASNGLWVKVPTRIHTADGQTLTIDYRVGQVDDGWLVLDVEVEGTSLVRTHRREYAGIIELEGVGGLIGIIETRNQAARTRASRATN